MKEAEKFFIDNSHYISDVELTRYGIYYSKEGVIEMMDKYHASQINLMICDECGETFIGCMICDECYRKLQP